MDRRDLSIILFFLMVAVGGGLPQALHWKVDHGCCGTGCAVAHVKESVSVVEPCCPHPHHTHTAVDQPIEIVADEEQASDDELKIAFYDEPMSDHHDCSVCQFLATLAALVTLAIVTPVQVDQIGLAANIPDAAVITSHRISSQGPRAPPHFI
jgi:hypothetical protein